MSGNLNLHTVNLYQLVSFLNVFLVDEVIGITWVQISTHPNVLHIHTTYFDNLDNLSPEFLKDSFDWYKKVIATNGEDLT